MVTLLDVANKKPRATVASLAVEVEELKSRLGDLEAQFDGDDENSEPDIDEDEDLEALEPEDMAALDAVDAYRAVPPYDRRKLLDILDERDNPIERAMGMTSAAALRCLLEAI